MLPLLDNDVIVKVASYGLIAEFDRLLRSNGAERPFRCVPAAYGSLRLSDKIDLFTRFYATHEERKDALAIFRMCETLPQTPVDANRLKRLSAIPHIDDGEARLVEYACGNPDSLILTGDKRCMLALAAEPSLADICATMKGRFVHFELIVEGLASMSSFKAVRERILAASNADERLAAALDSKYSETTARENLGRRIATLEAGCGGLLRAKF